MKCIFCGNPAGTKHHILPKVIRTEMKWDGKRAKRMLGNYNVPLCKRCHRKVSKLQEPLVTIIKHLRGSMPLPIEFMYLINGVYEELTQDNSACSEEKEAWD